MARELEGAGTGAKMTKVPQSRRATSESLLNLEREIDTTISDNKVVAYKSFLMQVNNL